MGLKLTDGFYDRCTEVLIHGAHIGAKIDATNPGKKAFMKETISNCVRSRVECAFHDMGYMCAFRASFNGEIYTISNEDKSYFSDEFVRLVQQLQAVPPGDDMLLRILYRDTINSQNPVVSGEWGELLVDEGMLLYRLNVMRPEESTEPRATVISEPEVF
jgi:hypothetical protein